MVTQQFFRAVDWAHSLKSYLDGKFILDWRSGDLGHESITNIMQYHGTVAALVWHCEQGLVRWRMQLRKLTFRKVMGRHKGTKAGWRCHLHHCVIMTYGYFDALGDD